MSSIREKLHEVWRAAAEAGRPLPSELALASSLGVSRPKLREELVRLESTGLVTRIPHSGTFPNRSALDMGIRLDQSYEFSEMIEDAGLEARAEILETTWCELDPDRSARLGVRSGSTALQTVKRWSAGGRPVMVAVDAIPSERREFEDFDSSDTVFELVWHLRGSAVEWETSWIQARMADPHEVELLDLQPTEAVLELTTLGVSLLGTALYHARETYRQGILPYGLIRSIPRRG